MDRAFYAYNKSLMESETQQRLENLDSQQNQRTDGPYQHPPSGQTFANYNPPRPVWSPDQTGGQQGQFQNSSNFHNGPLNGFQSNDASLNRLTAGENITGNKSVPPAPSQEFPSSSSLNSAIAQSGHAAPSFPSSGLPRHPFPPPSPSFQAPPTRPLFASQRQMYPAPQRQMYPPARMTPMGFSDHPTPPSFNYQQGRGTYPGEPPVSSNSSIGSPSGSQQASRSDTPVTGNVGHEDQSWNQLLSSQSNQNVPPFSSSQAQDSNAPATVNQSNYWTGNRAPPPHPQMLSQQQQLQSWQQQPPQSHPAGPFRHQPPPSQQRPIVMPQHQPGHDLQPPHQMPTQSTSKPPIHHQGYPQQAPPWQQQQQQQQFAQPSQYPQSHPNVGYQGLYSGLDGLSLNQGQVGMKLCNLTQEREVLPKQGFAMNEPVLNPVLKATNCSQEIMCCTLNAVPRTAQLLKKTRLPLGLLLHPFKDVKSLNLVQTGTIVRCRSCRTYINPFVTFLDPNRWTCNICQRENDVPTDFTYDKTTRSYVEPFHRPEVRSSTLEFVAPSEYLLRPPMPAVYFYLLDVSHNAIETGYLEMFCEILLEQLDRIPGDARKRIGFLAYDTQLYFFNLSEEQSQPQMIVVSDLEEPYLPCPEGLLVTLQESRSMVVDLLQKLPSMFKDNRAVGSAMGSALEFAANLMVQTGGRVSVFQTILPTVGAGALKNREESSERTSKNIGCMGLATDYYKKLALTCSTDHVAIDLFLFNSQYCDIATIGASSKFTGGCMYYFPNFHSTANIAEAKRFRSAFSRYLTRKIGFEAVMRIRCGRGLTIQNYHGNFFVRSTDLLNLPNLNPDAAYAVQIGLDDDISTNYVSFQTALLYTSSNAERRIRVHTLCIPVSSDQSDIEASANQLAIVGLLSKMAVDKSINLGLGDSREALVNAAVDILASCHASLSPAQRMPNQLLAPQSLKLIPLLILALMKSISLRIGVPTKIDDRIVAMETCKNLPWKLLLLHIHPYLYPVHNLDESTLSTADGKDSDLVLPSIVSLSSTQVDKHGAYLMDSGSYIYFYLGPAISDLFCLNVLGMSSLSQVPEGELQLPELESALSRYLRAMVAKLNDRRPVFAPLIMIKDGGKMKHLFYQYLIMDRTESSFSYQEFLQHIHKELKA